MKNEKVLPAGPDAEFVIDEVERARWAELGIKDRAAQDRVFGHLALAAERLASDEPESDKPSRLAPRIASFRTKQK